MVIDLVVVAISIAIFGWTVHVGRKDKKREAIKPSVIKTFKRPPGPPFRSQQQYQTWKSTQRHAPPKPPQLSGDWMEKKLEQIMADLPEKERKEFFRDFYTKSGMPIPKKYEETPEALEPVADDECPECGKMFVMADDYICPDCRKRVS